ncbi:ypt/Rab-GAP domain of gyp1p superfamily protein [Artemisia annua]|uniref:Ypt/Rab-GAP domain of gyp1p superfamily protein n=1 Tax=Artemisia annua TaxID=35608 RepID=A0A2U1P9U2_ARTAN|nr:ypt/Rab-GAP domain of gyp1p superfamily protein [Artemisia annua]
MVHYHRRIHATIRGEIWEFPLGCFDPKSAYEERKEIRLTRSSAPELVALLLELNEAVELLETKVDPLLSKFWNWPKHGPKRATKMTTQVGLLSEEARRLCDQKGVPHLEVLTKADILVGDLVTLKTLNSTRVYLIKFTGAYGVTDSLRNLEKSFMRYFPSFASRRYPFLTMVFKLLTGYLTTSFLLLIRLMVGFGNRTRKGC